MAQLDKTAIEARRKYAFAFNETMIRIWRERILKLGVIDKGALYRSAYGLKTYVGTDATEIKLQQQFLTYGIFQNFGVGKEVPRGNPGDIGRPKVREARHWFDKKYYSSIMNLRDFLAESMSKQYIGIVSNALSDRELKAATIASAE